MANQAGALKFSPSKQPKKPRVEMDGLCSYCGGVRYAPARNIVPRSVYEDDPYCSADCARSDHGTAS